MAKIKSKITKDLVDSYNEGADYEQPQPGRYRCKVLVCEIVPKKRKPDETQVKVTYEVDPNHPKYAKARLYDYFDPNSDDQQWKVTQFLVAMGLLDPGSKKKAHNVTWDTEEVKDTEVLVRVKADTYEGAYSAKVGTVLPYDADEDDEEEDDEEEFDEGDEGDEEEEEWEDEEGDEEEEEGLTSEDIEGMDADELKALMKEHELKKPKRIKGIKQVRAWLIEELIGMREAEEDDPF